MITNKAMEYRIATQLYRKIFSQSLKMTPSLEGYLYPTIKQQKTIRKNSMRNWTVKKRVLIAKS